MIEKLPIHYYQLSSGQWSLIEFQSGEVIPVSVGGTGASSTDGIKQTIGLFSSSTSGLVSSVPLATSAYTLLGNGWRLTSSIIGIESVSTLRDTTFAGSPSLNQVLTWNGTKWTAATPPGATGGEANTGSNIGGGPGSSFDYKLGVDLRFRTLSGVNIGVSTVGDLIQLSGVRPTTVSSVDSAVTTTVNATTDYDYYLVNTTTTSVTVYLPAASANTSKIITISKVDDGGSYRSVTVSGTELVTATNTVLLYDPTESVTVISNGTNWYSLDYDRSYGVVFVCKNSTGSTLTKGTPVRVTGATGANVLIGPVSAANNHIPSAPSGQLGRCIGVVEHDIPNGEFGHVLTKGSLYKYNTNSFNEGDVLYLAASGGFTNVKPTPPYEEVFLGIVTRKQSINGSILIDVANPIHINDIVGFNLSSSLTNNDLICYDSTTSTFKNIQPSTILTGAAGEVNTGSNIGSGPGSSFSGKVGVDLQFRTLSGINLNISTVGNVVLVSGSGGVTDHGSLTGLADDDHPQYVLSSTNSTLSSTVSNHIASSTVHFTQAEIDHGAILGLADNDHPQYVLSSTNSALSSLVNNHVTSSTVHFTQAEIDHGVILGLSDNDHPQYVLSATNSALSSLVDNHIASSTVHFTQAQIDHGVILGLSDNDHPQYVLSSTNSGLSSLVNNHIASSVHWDLTTLNSNYINTSGDSANAAFFFQTLSATTASATTYLNLPSSIATWNASALQGKTLNAASPTINEILRYNGTQWINDSETQYSLNSELGSSWIISGASGITFTTTTPNNFRVAASYTSGIWNASALQGSPLSATLVPTTNQSLVYNGSVWTASTLPAVITDHGALTGLEDNDHPQYVLSSTNSTLSSTVSNHIASSTVHFTQAEIDHGVILGLADNDHPQYVLSSTNSALSSLVNNHIASAVHWDLTTLNSNYINASGDSANAAFFFQTLSATTASATTYLNLPSSTAIWNANKLVGYEINTVAPGDAEFLVFDQFNNYWTPSTVTLGGGGGGIADASSLRGSPLSATLVPTAGQALMYNGSVWTASAALFAYTYGSGAPTGGSDGDIYLQTDVEALQVATVSATTYLNLPSSVITWTYATSATSALNAQQAPNGFTVTGTLSSTNLLTTSGDVSAVRLTDYSERKSAPTISSSSLTLDLNAAQVFTVSLNSNISTLTISNTESRANSVQGFTLILTADGTARTITWPGSVKWPSGTGPTLTSTNNKVDILSFVSPDNGTTWYGFIGGQNY